MFAQQDRGTTRPATRGLPTINHSRAVARGLPTINHSRAVARAMYPNHSRCVADTGRG